MSIMDDGKIAEEVRRFYYEDYITGFIAKDPERYANTFALPCLIRAEDLPRTAFQTRAELLGYCTEMICRARDTTWHDSTIDSFEVEVLDPAVVQLRVVASRFDKDGKRLARHSRLYGRYTVNREADGWKMAAIFGGFLPD